MGPIKQKVHINCDLGEGYGNFKCGPDDELIPMIDHANVACGFHAGDPLIMYDPVCDIYRSLMLKTMTLGKRPSGHARKGA
ncbi:uncharacterized protein LTR77_002701 [Saxophila tyrrhenica]|uniref:LamB/YcsF family protein n=1 Tax=Saxophila tyrrhenica TaxID=1690608 RepID=A0AAV9PFE9_9PEZI|nr:hypothetical protein LTR77_002701 [Saxophila tyrrhenica]